MGKRSKSKRFTQQNKDEMKRFDERFPYKSTLAEDEERKAKLVEKTTLGGI